MEHIRLNATQRTALRRAICDHASWEKYRRQHGNMTSADLTSSRSLDVAREFGIDIGHVLASVPEETSSAAADSRASYGSGKADSAAAVEQAAALPADKAQALALLSSLLTPQVDRAEIEAIVSETVARALENAGAIVRIQLTRADNSTWQGSGNHPMFPRLLRALSARQANGTCINVWLAGPTGSGKTYAAEQAALALGVPFYFNGALGMSHEVLGFVDGSGHYHTTPFRQAFEHGGVYLFDECDASDNSALLPLNAALANGSCSFPDSATPIKRHADFRCIAAANTFGQGATAEFIGRARLDAAFLSRFAVKLHWTYDDKLEQDICGNKAWAIRVQNARKAAAAAGLKIVIDPRHSFAGAALIANGATSDEAANDTYLSGLSADQRRLIEGN